MDPTSFRPCSQPETTDLSANQTPGALESKASAIRSGLQPDAPPDTYPLKRLVTVGDANARDVSGMNTLAAAERNAWPLPRVDAKADPGRPNGQAQPPRVIDDKLIDASQAAPPDRLLGLAQAILELAREGTLAGWQALDLALMIGKAMQDEPRAFRSLLLSQMTAQPSAPDLWAPLSKDPIALGLGLAADPLAIVTHGGLDVQILDRCMSLWSRCEGLGDDWQRALVQHLAQGRAGETGESRAERLIKLFDARLDGMSPELCLDISHALLTLVEADEQAQVDGKSAGAGDLLRLAPALPSATQVTGLLNRFLQAHGFDPFRKDRPFGARSRELDPILRRDDKQSGHASEVWEQTRVADKIGSPISAGSQTKDQQLAMNARKVRSFWTHLQVHIARLRAEPHPPRLGLRSSMIAQYEAVADRLSREFSKPQGDHLLSRRST